MRVAAAFCVLFSVALVGQETPSSLAEGRRALAAKQFPVAWHIFAAYLKQHPADAQAQLGVGDAELGLHQYEAAELTYRRVVAAEPMLWQAHRNLVIVEAALHRWEEFDRERALLHAARERGSAGLSVKDSDIIDVIRVGDGEWIVRDYFEPLGRARARYNFEHFSRDGRVLAYVSLESADAFRTQQYGGGIAVGPEARGEREDGLALNWYNGKAHGTIATYRAEPAYEAARADFLRWLRHPVR